MLPLFAPKQTFVRIDFLRQGGRLVGKKALIMLKFPPKTRQNNDYAMYKHMGIGIVSTTFTTASPCGCRACCPRPIMAAPRKRRNNLSATAGFQLVDNTMYPYRLLHSLSKNKGVFHSFLSTFRVFVGVLPVLFS